MACRNINRLLEWILILLLRIVTDNLHSYYHHCSWGEISVYLSLSLFLSLYLSNPLLSVHFLSHPLSLPLPPPPPPRSLSTILAVSLSPFSLFQRITLRDQIFKPLFRRSQLIIASVWFLLIQHNCLSFVIFLLFFFRIF